MTLTKIDDRGLKTPIDLLDNEQIRIGTGNDLKLYHDGTDSYINSNQGELKIYGTGGTIRLRAHNDKNSIIALPSAAVELYYDNSKKLETYTGGVEIVGDCFFEDNNKLKIGSSSDLEIYHDGTNNQIKSVGSGQRLTMQSTSGTVHLAGTIIRIKDEADSETMATFSADGAVELYYNNIKTFNTNGDGISVLGTEGGSAVLYLLADEGDDNADKFRLVVDDGGYFFIQNVYSGSWETNFKATGDGSVELYHNNSQRLYTSTTGAVILSDGDTTLSINGGAGDSGYAQLNLNGNATSDNWIQSDNGLSYWINGANRYKMETDGTFIVQDGNVKIATAGHGIDFAATAGPTNGTGGSELLADYEEGTFTPLHYSYNGSAWVTLPFTTAPTTNNGTYTKVGNLVHWRMVITGFQTNATGSSYAKLGGLPYSNDSGGYSGADIAYQNNLGTVDQEGGFITGTQVELYRGHAWNTWDNTNSGRSFYMSGTYLTS